MHFLAGTICDEGRAVQYDMTMMMMIITAADYNV